MSILFSKVELTTDDDSAEFLMGGIPHSQDDMDGWTAYEDFIDGIDSESEVSVHAEAYLYGGGETVTASPEEVAYMTIRMNQDDRFLSGHCDNIEDVDFAFLHTPEESCDMEMG